jgi:hypothetical protein
MADKFRIESRNSRELYVRHMASGFRYRFRVSESTSGQRELRGVYAPGSASRRLNREALERSARAFAERAYRNRSQFASPAPDG